MFFLGKYQALPISRFVDFGAYLDAGPMGEVLLPKRWLQPDWEEGQEVEAFIYQDAEERPIATTEKPKIQVNEFAPLTVKNCTRDGCFMDWGLIGRDLFVPFAQQLIPMREGFRYVIYAYIDEASGRITGSSHYKPFLDKELCPYPQNKAVDLLITERHPQGYMAIIDRRFSGLLYENEVFRRLKVGDQVKGYIKKVRDDGKIDLRLQPSGFKESMPKAEEKVWQAIERQSDGFLPLHDKSSPEKIYAELQMSKKRFKQAIGALYRKRLISISQQGIRKKEEKPS